MKANELMLGDWVQNGRGDKFIVIGFSIRSFLLEKVFDDGFNIREAIEHREFMIEGVGPDLDNYEMLSCNLEHEVKPIPLTPEILKKNGFDFLYSSVPGGTPQEQRMRKVDTYEWRGLVVNYYHETNDFQMVNFRGVRLDYVHQFQHALRLCGIEKEIVL